MSIMSSKINRGQSSGFTIVELLIVIVVIAILAAISIVAYNGIQQRARNSQVVTGVNAYYKALLQYQTVKGNFPVLTGCLGANYPNDACWQNNGVTDIGVNAALDTELSEFVPNKPTLATSVLDMYAPYKRAGLVYRYVNASFIEVRYYLSGTNNSCISGFSGVNEGALTNCSKVLSN